MSYSMQGQIDLFNINGENNANDWFIVNDGVMGGLSEGNFKILKDHAIFDGEVSTRNNGGFTMVRASIKDVDIKGKTKVVLKLKGDGKSYQFRVKSDIGQRHAYVYEFKTSGDWEEISIPFNQLLPKFRGRSLDMPVFQGENLSEIAFLIGNKREESFQLMLRHISIE